MAVIDPGERERLMTALRDGTAVLNTRRDPDGTITVRIGEEDIFQTHLVVLLKDQERMLQPPPGQGQVH
jgi:hypothetical protein